MSVVIEARKRHFGVTAKQAKDERLGTALKRLAFRELISDLQYQAGVIFADLYQKHHIVIGLPMPSPSSVAGLLINEGIFGASPRCLIPGFDGAIFSQEWKEALWARFFTDAPQRLRRSVAQYRIVKKA